MTKTLIAGLATIVVAGSALITTGMYAAATGTNQTRMAGIHMDRPTAEQMAASLSGKVSPEVLSAFTTLTARHKTEMDALKSNSGTTLDKASMKAKREVFQTEMDALMAQYPELKSVLPAPLSHNKKGNKNNPMGTILAGVSATDKVEIEAIRTEYQTKQESLRTEEKWKIDAIIARYPDLKAKLDALKASEKTGDHNGGREGRGPRGR